MGITNVRTEGHTFRSAKQVPERKGIPSGGQKKREGREGPGLTGAINRRAEGPTALPKAGAKLKAKRLNLLPLPLFFFRRFLPKNRMFKPSNHLTHYLTATYDWRVSYPPTAILDIEEKREGKQRTAQTLTH